MTRTACLEELAAAIVAPKLDHPTRVAIDGVDGSGKTTLADEPRVARPAGAGG